MSTSASSLLSVCAIESSVRFWAWARSASALVKRSSALLRVRRSRRPALSINFSIRWFASNRYSSRSKRSSVNANLFSARRCVSISLSISTEFFAVCWAMKSIARCLSSSVIGGSCLSRRMISAIESTLESLYQAKKLQIRSSILQQSAYARAQAMFVNLFQRAQRQCQRAAAIFTRHQWLLAARRCLQKAFGLGAQGLDIFHRERLGVDAGPRAMGARRSQVADRSVISCVIDVDVIARLEKTHLANLLGPDARGGDVRYRAGRKFQARIGGVDALSQDRNTHRL